MYRKEVMRKMMEAKEVIKNEIKSLRREIDDQRKWTRDFHAINTVDYVNVTANNKRFFFLVCF